MRRILFVVGSVIASSLVAQSSLSFEKVDHDFGDIREEDGFAEYRFNFVNSGSEPVRITNVKASCGCTTPGWTREEVMPGDSGFVKARYNPRNRPGKFRKSLRISTSDPESNQTLYIMGMVKPKPKTPEQAYPVLAGKFRLKYQALNLGKITTEKPVQKSFEIYNGSDSVASLEPGAQIIPDHLKVSIAPESIGPKQVGQLMITYDPIARNDFGFVSDNLVLDTASANNFSVLAIIEEFFPPMSPEEMSNAPKLEVSSRNYKFDKVKAGVILEKSFVLSNTGKAKLEFRAIKSNCECLTYEIKKSSLRKGKEVSLDVRFDTSEMRGNQFKSISIYSNDPANPTQIINIRGAVEK